MAMNNPPAQSRLDACTVDVRKTPFGSRPVERDEQERLGSQIERAQWAAPSFKAAKNQRIRAASR